MKITILIILAMLFVSHYAKSQNQLGKSDDLARLSLTAVVPDELKNIPTESKKMLTNKLNNIAAKNGLAGSATNPRFIITANANIETKDITPTAPPKTAITLSITFYIADAVSQIIFASTQISAKGVGNNETKAYNSALNSIAPTNTQIRAMIEEGKEKILEYYNSQCDIILKEAQSKADMKDFGYSFYILTSVPTVSKECYDKAMEMIPIVYKQYIDWKCDNDLTKAKAFWSQKDYTNALAHLAEISVESKCYEPAEILMKEIEVNLTEADRQEFRRQQVEDRKMDMAQSKIDAVLEIATTAIKNNRGYYSYNLGWLFGY